MENLMPHPREQFWSEAHTLLQSEQSWSDRCTALTALVESYDCGHALLKAGPRPDCDSDTGIATPLPDDEIGYRCFFKSWDTEEETGIHGHPNTMFVYVMTVELESVGYQRQGQGIAIADTLRYRSGQVMTGRAENEKYDNFIHNVRCIQPGWSLHIYSDSGTRGLRFDENAVQ